MCHKEKWAFCFYIMLNFTQDSHAIFLNFCSRKSMEQQKNKIHHKGAQTDFTQGLIY